MARQKNQQKDVFTESDYYLCPPLTDSMIAAAEESLAYRLPKAYIELLRIRNGGYLRRHCFPTTRRTSWSDDHVSFHFTYGIGGENGIDGKTGSRYLIREWDYPDVGVVISATGHTAFMLDYKKCGPQGEPRVIWVDVETGGKPDVLELAPDFVTFLAGLSEKPPRKER
jgi:hypothetical protein